jgi:hypothetical protein
VARRAPSDPDDTPGVPQQCEGMDERSAQKTPRLAQQKAHFC